MKKLILSEAVSDQQYTFRGYIVYVNEAEDDYVSMFKVKSNGQVGKLTQAFVLYADGWRSMNDTATGWARI